MTLMFEALKRIEAQRTPESSAVPQWALPQQAKSNAAPQSPEVIEQIDSIQKLVAITAGYGISVQPLPAIDTAVRQSLVAEPPPSKPNTGIPENLPTATYAPRPPAMDWETEPEIAPDDIPTIYPMTQPAISLDGPYGGIARKIYQSLPHDRPHVLGFTSPGHDQGATTVAFNVACSLTDLSVRSVLVLDGNFDNADMSHRNGKGSRFGLDDVLRGTVSWREILQPTDTPRMSLLPIASPYASALDAAQRRALPGLLKELGGSFGLLIVDTGSLADPRSLDLLAECEMAYMVVRLGHASARMLRESQRLLRRRGTSITGAVIVG